MAEHEYPDKPKLTSTSEAPVAYWMRQIIGASGIVTWLWNIQTGAVNLNQSSASYFGCATDSDSPNSAQDLRNFIHSDDLIEFDRMLHAHQSGALDAIHCDVRMRHRSGQWVWGRIQGRIVTRDESGQPEWLAGSVIEIDQLRQLKQELKESHARLQNLIKSIPAALYSVDLVNMELETYSDVEDVLGYAESKFTDLKVWYESVLHPEDQSKILEEFTDWLRSGAKTTLIRAYRLLNREGQYMWVRDRTRAGNRDDNGRITTLYGSITDISRTMTVHERIEKIASTVPGAIYQYQIDAQGKASFPYTSAGIEMIYGLTPEQVQRNSELIF